MLKSVNRSPAGVGEMLHERDESVIPDQARKLCRWEEHFKRPRGWNAPQTVKADQDVLLVNQDEVRASGSDSKRFEVRSSVRQGCALSPTLVKHIIDWILG